MSPKRKPRFKRVRVRRFRITKRDVEIIKHVHYFRLLDSQLIHKLVGGSAQNLLRRLELLYHGGYLDRPRVQITEYFDQTGTRRMVYALGRKGASLLRDHLGIEIARVDWSAKNRGLKIRFFKHRLMISSVLVAFEASCQERGNVRMIYREEMLTTKAPEETRGLANPDKWSVTVSGVGRVSVAPDAMFGLEFAELPDGKNRTYFFLEADRATMPVASRIGRKLMGYRATYLQGVHTKRLGLSSFRVLTVTISPKGGRLRTMVETATKLPSHHGVFLFADHDSLAGGDALSHRWNDGHDKGVRLRSS